MSETETTLPSGDELLEELGLKNTPAEHEAEPEGEEDLDKIRKPAPPKRGICRRCGEDKPINRLMLCYKCWTITNIEDWAKGRGETWTPGMPHPAWCKCEGLGGHPKRDRSAGN